MHRLYELRDALIDELCEHGENGVTKETLPEIDTLAHAAKNVCKIIDTCDSEYSGRYYPYSYRRGRDRMGRFKSMDQGPEHVEHSGKADPDVVINTLERLMVQAGDARTEGKFRELIRDMRNR